ncbi:MAG: efflux transporter periplasmic adaptor subunit [Desulfuromonadales bacterium GWC2_61_20]|nr:MAG: efflux transporter periplasmic adaptor subunit [Desulfuromonadales bacterium GWC2_61_20]HAD04119.1 efflux RND transporter periplasmic adaptor subunit [Desulfuromonas sp.]
MNRKIAIPLALLALAGIFAGGYFAGSHRHDEPVTAAGQQEAKTQWTCGMHPFIIRDEPGLCPICGMELTPLKPGTGGSAPAEKKITHWISSMDPTYVRDAPGKDTMGMDLVPVYEGGGEAGTVSIDPVTAQNMGVRIAPVERRNLARTLRTVGVVTFAEPLQSSINTKIEGWLERLYIDQTGQQVKKGAPVAEIYSPDLVAAQQEYLLAVRNQDKLAASDLPGVADGARRMLEAARTRLNYWGISDRQLAELQRSGTPQRTMTLHSPFTGVVTMKKAVQGMRVMAGEEIAQLADLSTVWVNAEIYQSELPWIKLGQSATVELPYAGGKSVTGKVTFIQPMIGAESRTVKARIELANPGFALKPDMFANVVIRAEESRQSLAIPAEAVLDSGVQQTVFVSLGDGKFAPRPVKTGVKDDGGYVQILDGLKDGEQVVISAQFMLDSESKLREALRKMTEPQAPAAAPAGTKQEKLDDLFK